MKFRQFLRNSFQTAIEKHQEYFFKESKSEAETVQEEPENADAFECNFREFANLSKRKEQQITEDTEHQMIINEGTISNLSVADTVGMEMASDGGSSVADKFQSTESNHSNTSVATASRGNAINFSSITSASSLGVNSNPQQRSVANALIASGEIVPQGFTPIASLGTDTRSASPAIPNHGADFAVEYNVEQEVASPARKIGKRGKKSYSFTPKKSKGNEKAIEKTTKKKKQIGSLKLKIEKKAQIIRQLSILLDAGMDLRSSLAVIEEQEVRNKNVWFFIHDLFTKIEAGDSFSDALLSSTVKFDESEIAMVRAGEAVGKQSETLAKMASLMEKKVRIKKKITSAMFYPATVLLVSSVVVLLLTTFVVPKFEKVIADQIGAKGMPALTNVIIQTSRFISSHLMEVFMIIGILIAMVIGAKTIGPVKKAVYGLLLALPLIGDCITKWCVVLFSRTFGDLLLCGCSVIESLKMARESIGNYYMKANLTLTIDDVQQGMSLTESLKRRSVLPVMAEGLIKVGEESGKLGEMMNKVSLSYEEQLDEVITRITSLIEPILVIFLAIFVGGVVIGLFLPLVSLIQNISG